MPSGGWRQGLLAVSLIVLGVAVGLATVVVHGRPVGLVLALAATAAAAYALPGGWRTRFSFCAGWVGVVAYATQPRGEGDYLIGRNVPGYVLLAFTLVLLILAVVTAARPRSAGSDSYTGAREDEG